MGFNRIEAKIRAKTSIRQGKPNAMRVSMVYLLLTSLLTSLLMSALRFDLPELLYYYAQRGYEPDEILSILWSQNAGQIGLSWAMSLVLGIYTMIMALAMSPILSGWPETRTLAIPICLTALSSSGGCCG